jgi:serine/threonine protein kinase
MGMPLERLVERYTKEEKLGEGGVGIAYKAEGIKDGKLYVIKIFDINKIKNSVSDSEAKKIGVDKEALALQILKEMLENNKRIKEILEERKGEKGWNNIKYIEEVGDTDAPYVVTEYIRYNLKEYMSSKGRIDPHQALRIVLDVAIGLRFIYESTKSSRHPIIAHTDVCPENIYIDVDERGEIKTVKLGDFDGAWIPEISIHPIMIHMDYKPPEGKPSEKFDVYALGIILAELIGGKRAADLLKEKGTVDEIDELREFKELIEKSTEKKENRMTVDEFIKTIENMNIKEITKGSIKEICEEWLDILEDYKRRYRERPIPVPQENMLRSISSKFDELIDLWHKESLSKLNPLINEIRSDLEDLKEMRRSTRSG